ncbi:MAG: L,D-transpeptidase [Clostridia bacterium]|nr:L,D-transpeptidase [Clostridia bacterium]
MRRALILFLILLCLCLPALAEEPTVQDSVVILGQGAQIRYTVPETGSGSLLLTDADGNWVMELLSSRTMVGGKHALNLEASAFEGLPEGEYRVVLSLACKQAVGKLILSETEPETDDMIAESAPLPVITPAYRSGNTCGKPGCYWCTPMDISDEAAVWAMLTSPMTVIDAGQKEQVLLYAEPDSNSQAIAVITGASQGVHVLEERSDGWTKVETYSSSFHDSKVKNWNAFVTGYIQSGKLKQAQANQEYGIVIDKLTQRLYLFHEGKMMAELLCSTGLYNERQPYNETRSGEFMIISRVGDFKSDNLVCGLGLRFNSGDLLHEVPHTVNADGSKNYKNCESKLGTRASHGCIRVQRLRNPDGINMRWIWDNIKVGTKLVIWEDYQGRQIAAPADSTPVYYNPNGGSNYHSAATCKGVKDQYLPLTAFTYGELDSGAYAGLTPCPYCCPPRRKAEIAAINEEHMKSSPGEIMAIIGE